MIVKIKTEMAVKRKNSKTLPEDEYFHQAKDKLAKWSPCSASQGNPYAGHHLGTGPRWAYCDHRG